jgi:hypothetical protein
MRWKLLLTGAFLVVLGACETQEFHDHVDEYEADIEALRLWINGDPGGATPGAVRGLKDWQDNVARAICNLESYIETERAAGNLTNPLPDPGGNTTLCGPTSGKNGDPPPGPGL